MCRDTELEVVASIIGVVTLPIHQNHTIYTGHKLTSYSLIKHNVWCRGKRLIMYTLLPSYIGNIDHLSTVTYRIHVYVYMR